MFSYFIIILMLCAMFVVDSNDDTIEGCQPAAQSLLCRNEELSASLLGI